MRLSPSTVLAGAALFFALGGSAVAVTEAVRPQARCQPGAVRGYIVVSGDPAKGMANLPDTFTSRKPEIGARFNCAGAAPQARRVNVGVYEVRFPGNAPRWPPRARWRPRPPSATSAAASSASASGFRAARTRSTRLHGARGLARVAPRGAGLDTRRPRATQRHLPAVRRARACADRDEVVRRRGVDRDSVRDGWQRLHAAPRARARRRRRGDPHGEPVLGRPDPIPSRTRPAVEWYANCAWDAFGICAALQVDGRVESACPDCGEPIAVEMRGGAPDDDSLLFHCLVPAERWWDDIGFT